MDCPVCLEVFKNPLLLPGCGHTICQACAEVLVTEGNFLRCPECRLIYQLRRGVKSLPKNVALQRTIDERDRAISNKSGSAGCRGTSILMCETHPDDIVSLYCKTCEKAICLKCFFQNTLRKGDSLHAGHQVDTSEDIFTKERRLLEEKCRDVESKQRAEQDYIARLEVCDARLKSLLVEKLSQIDQNKNSLIALVKQTSAKLKFTLNGSVVQDSECLAMSLQSAKERLTGIDAALCEAIGVLNVATNDNPQINLLKATRKKLDELPDGSDCDRPSPESFSKLESFDTDVQSCLNNPKRALSYQTECPRTPTLNVNDCTVSINRVHVKVTYSEVVRVQRLRLYYIEEASHKDDLLPTEWNYVEASGSDIVGGYVDCVLTGLKRATKYKAFAVASNDIGDSQPSDELWFQTIDSDFVDVQIVSR